MFDTPDIRVTLGMHLVIVFPVQVQLCSWFLPQWVMQDAILHIFNTMFGHSRGSVTSVEYANISVLADN